MTESAKKCMVCAQPVAILKGGICLACQDKIRREALGEQARGAPVRSAISPATASLQNKSNPRSYAGRKIRLVSA